MSVSHVSPLISLCSETISSLFFMFDSNKHSKLYFSLIQKVYMISVLPLSQGKCSEKLNNKLFSNILN